MGKIVSSSQQTATEEHAKRNRDSARDPSSGHEFRNVVTDLSGLAGIAPSLLTDRRLAGTASAPLRTEAFIRSQQTYGNRAVQRYLQRSANSTADEELLSRTDAATATSGRLDTALSLRVADNTKLSQGGRALPVQRLLGLDWASDAVSGAWDWTKSNAGAVADGVGSAANWVGEKASAAGTWAKEVASDAWGGITSGADWAGDQLSKGWDWTKEKASGVANTFDEGFDWLGKETGLWGGTKAPATGFDTLAEGGLKEGAAPANITLPKEMQEGMKTAWDKSFPGGQSQEQGGILVKNPDGSYEWKAGTAKPRSEGGSGAFSPNRDDTGMFEELVGTAHTHPYDESEGGHTDVPFSGTDLANMIYGKEKLKMVQSGEGQFVSARTAEFDKMVEDLDDAGKKKLHGDMKKEFDAIMYDPKDTRTFEERNKAAALAISKKYHLLYYEGKEGELALQ